MRPGRVFVVVLAALLASAGPTFGARRQTIETVPGQSLTPAQRTEKAAAYLAALEEELRAVLIMLEYAREQKQAVRISCLVEKLELMTPHVHAVRRLVTGLLEQPTAAESLALFEAMAPHVPAVIALRAEADQCVGELAQYTEGTVVEVQQQEPDNVETIFFAEQVEIDARPPAVSPYQLRQL